MTLKIHGEIENDCGYFMSEFSQKLLILLNQKILNDTLVIVVINNSKDNDSSLSDEIEDPW